MALEDATAAAAEDLSTAREVRRQSSAQRQTRALPSRGSERAPLMRTARCLPPSRALSDVKRARTRVVELALSVGTPRAELAAAKDEADGAVAGFDICVTLHAHKFVCIITVKRK